MPAGDTPLNMSFSDFISGLSDMIRKLPTTVQKSGQAMTSVKDLPGVLSSAAGGTTSIDPVKYWRQKLHDAIQTVGGVSASSIMDQPYGIDTAPVGSAGGH